MRPNRVSLNQFIEALAFYASHREEIDANLAAEGAAERHATGAGA